MGGFPSLAQAGLGKRTRNTEVDSFENDFYLTSIFEKPHRRVERAGWGVP